MKHYKLLFEKEMFTEMSRIGNLPKHSDISVWVNEKGEDREEPHFHIRLSDNSEYRLRMKDLSDMDIDKRDGKTLSRNILNEIKQWLLMPRKALPQISNLEFALETWNAQEGHKQKISLNKIIWK